MKTLKHYLKLFIPPIVLKVLNNKKKSIEKQSVAVNRILDSTKQDLDLYWDLEYAKTLEEWGKDNTWNEIQMILCTCNGKVLDIACGTGITIKLLERFECLELHGFDISDVLIQKGIDKGILPGRLKVMDATKTDYLDNQFDYSYSIGSLEHFTTEGIEDFIRESARVTRIASFHMIPVSKSDTNEGWMKTVQSFHNNSVDWWYPKFVRHFRKVHMIPSKWEDHISYGKWFICIK